MGRIKKGEKVAMEAIIAFGYSFLRDDMGGEWTDDEIHTELGFTMKELRDAFNRLMKKGGFQ